VSLAEFAVAAALFVVVPGAGTMVVIRNALRGGARGGVATAGGMVAGIFVHAVLAAAGAAVLLARSPGALAVLRVGGAGFIAWLGLDMLRTAWTGALPRARAAGAATTSPARSLREGLATNLLNPPLPLFYVAIIPNVLRPGDDPLSRALVLAGVHGAEAFTWLSLISVAVGRAQALLERDRPRRAIEAVAGVALIGLALRLALAAPV
jgi:threonine/homoserine/homoserine lactone efflux protein